MVGTNETGERNKPGNEKNKGGNEKDIGGYARERKMTQPPRHYIQTISYSTFPDTTGFHSIPNEITGETTTSYTIPNGLTWYPAFIMASQTNDGMSIIGIYINGELFLVVPFRNDLHYILYEPLRFDGGITIEIKIRPHKKKMGVCILIGGDITKEH